MGMNSYKMLVNGTNATVCSLARNFLSIINQPANECEPIILMHGFAGFREIKIFDHVLFEYFNGVVQLLTQMGYRAYAPQVVPFGTPQSRAARWMHHIEEIRQHTGADKVHLIAHSQGGLDARVLIAPTGPAQDTPLGPLAGLGYEHVNALITIGAPHLGCALVDQMNGDKEEKKIIKAISEIASLIAMMFDGKPQDAMTAIESIGRKYMLEYFNNIIKDNPEVKCYTIAGNPESEKLVSPILKDGYEGLLNIPENKGGGPNDGFVTVKSAWFGQTPNDWPMPFSFDTGEEGRSHWTALGHVQADHIAEVGIPMDFPPNKRYDHLACFAGMAQLLDPFYKAEMKLLKSGQWVRNGTLVEASIKAASRASRKKIASSEG